MIYKDNWRRTDDQQHAGNALLPLDVPLSNAKRHLIPRTCLISRSNISFAQTFLGVDRQQFSRVLHLMDRRSFLTMCMMLPFARSAGAAALSPWPRGYVSLAYDDGLSSQLDIAAPQLEAAGFRGTFYVTWDNISDRAAEWAALAKRGHELANHTMTHPCDLQDQAVGSFRERQIDPLEHWLAKVEGTSRDRDFAYPCDVTDLGPGNPNQQARRFARLLRGAGIRSARTSEGPPNSARWAEHAPYRLHALALGYDTQGLSEVRDYIEEAVRRKDWAILVIHEIGKGARSDGFISPAEHSELVAMISAMKVPCGTVQSAFHASNSL